MVQYLLFLVLSSLWLGGVVSFSYPPEDYALNTGDCYFATEFVLYYYCVGNVSKDMTLRWADYRVTIGVPYTVWRGQTFDGFVTLVSFYNSRIRQFYKVKILPTNYGIVGGLYDENYSAVKFQHSDMHCFNYTLRYFTDLIRNCFSEPYDPNDRLLDHGILHYAEKHRVAGAATQRTVHPIALPLVFLAVFLNT